MAEIPRISIAEISCISPRHILHPIGIEKNSQGQETYICVLPNKTYVQAILSEGKDGKFYVSNEPTEILKGTIWTFDEGLFVIPAETLSYP